MTKAAEHWLKAHIQIEISGDGEAFLQAAAWEKLPLQDVHREEGRLLVRLRVDDLAKLRRTLRLSHCSMHILRRSGWPFFLAFMRRRPLLPLSCALLIAALCLVSTLIFQVSVSSLEALPQADYQRVLAVAEENGLRPGAFLWQVDLEHCKRQISLNFPELFFVEISRHGVRWEIRIAKRIDLAPAQQPRSPGDVLASCDGVVQDILVRRGTAAVRSGDTVVKGQVLIYGWQGLEGSVAADGMVYARVWAEAYAECPQEWQELQPTGRSQPLLQLRGSQGAILTLIGREQPFDYQESQLQAEPLLPPALTWLTWRNNTDTVELIHGIIGELRRVTVQHSYEEALAIAAHDAELQARAQLAASCDIGSTSITHIRQEELRLDEPLARIRVTLEAESQIGLYAEHLWEEDPLPGGLPPEEEADW